MPRTARDLEVPDRVIVLKESTQTDRYGTVDVAVWFTAVTYAGEQVCAVDMTRDINRAQESGPVPARGEDEDIQRRLLILTRPMLERMLAELR